MDEIEELVFFPTCFIMFQKAQSSFDQQIPKSPCVPWKVVTILGARLWWRPMVKRELHILWCIGFLLFSNRHTPYHNISLVNCFFWGCKTFSYVQLCIHVVLCLSLWKICLLMTNRGWSSDPGCQTWQWVRDAKICWKLEVEIHNEFSGSMIL